MAGEELLDLGEHRVDVAGEVEVIGAVELHEPGGGDGVCQVAVTSTRIRWSSRRCRTSVGTWMAARMSRRSIPAYMSNSFRAMPGLAPSRWYPAQYDRSAGSSARLGAHADSPRPLPQRSTRASSRAVICAGSLPHGRSGATVNRGVVA